MKARKNYLIFLLTLVILAVLTWAFLVPKVQEVFNSKKKLDQEKARLGALETKLADLQGLNEFELAERTRISLEAIPAQKNFLEVLAVLSQLAGEQGLILETFMVNPGKLELKEKGKLAYKITLGGQTETLKAFIKELARILPLLDPSGTLRLSLQEGSPSVDLIVEGYFLPLPQTLGSLETSVPKLTANEERSLTTLSGYRTLPVLPLPQVTGKEDPFNF